MPLITPGENILHNAIMDILAETPPQLTTTLRKALVEYADAVKIRTARWNDPVDWEESNTVSRAKVPKMARDAGHPSWAKVRPTDYNEVSDILGTAGCSKFAPHYTWTVLGVIETPHGKQIVSPGDWIVELYPGRPIVMPHDEYVKMFVV